MPTESSLTELLLRWEELRDQGQALTPEDRALCEHRLGRPDEAERWVDPLRKWHSQFLAAVQGGGLSKAIRLDPRTDWQARILLESLLRELEEKSGGSSP